MIYLQILLGVGCVVAAAAAAIYLSMSNPVPQVHQYSNRRDDDNDNDYCGKYDKPRKSKTIPKSKPGDKCLTCLEEMTANNMHIMNCDHALCTTCFQQYRNLRRDCPLCGQTVIRIDMPGDNCAICCHALMEDTMEYMKCEHAIHTKCLANLRDNNYKKCTVCLRPM